DRHAFRLEVVRVESVKEDDVDGPAFERLRLYALIAERLHQNIVALRIEAKVLEPQHRSHPGAAAVAIDSDAFAADVLRSLDRRLDDDVVGISRGKRRDHFEIVAARDRG